VVKSSLNTSGLTDPVSSSALSAVLSPRRLRASLIYLCGTLMVLLATWLPPKTLRFTSSPSLTTVIPSDRETTSWSSVRPTCGKTLPTRSSSPLTLTSDTSPTKFGTLILSNYPGTELSRNILSFPPLPNSLAILLDGPTMVTLELKDPTTALSVPTLPSVAASLTLTTRLASTLESTFLEPTLKLCPDSGNTKLDLVSELQLEMNY
jgi:hypothetical protein